LANSLSELPNVTGSSATDSTSGVIAFSDPDLNDRPTPAAIDPSLQTVTWTDATHDYTSELTSAQIALFKAAFAIAAEAGNTNTGDVDWTFQVVDKKLDFLSVGEKITITTPVTIDDHNGGTVTPNIVVTLNGANDNPIALPDSNGTAKKSTLTVSAHDGVLANDTDPDVHDNGHLGVSAVNGFGTNVGHSVAGTYGSLTLNADGSYVYVANQGSLPAKIVAQDTFAYTVSDPHGGTDTDNLYIVVFNPGTNYMAGINTTLNGGNGPDVVDGFAGNDIVLGGNGPDVLIGGNGDTLTGGNGPDTYLFRPHFGTNTITDFDTHNDNMQFDKSIFTSAADILANHTTDTAGGAVISDGLGDTITLVGVHQSQLSAGMFLLV
jgi:VCBS repeat-containing protein